MRYGLIGDPLGHSYSKEIHEALGKYEYELFPLKPEEMRDFVGGRDFGGLNVTIPYKRDVMPLCDEISELAERIGAVNTLYWRREVGEACNGRIDARTLVGHNTDYEGFLYAAQRAGIEFTDKTVLVLGTGGTSLTARHAVADNGAKKVYIASRREACPADGQQRFPQFSYGQLASVAGEVDVIINTTPVGMYPNTGKAAISLTDFPRCEAVIDVIYNPFRTALLLDAEKRGLKFSNGLPMLVAQATAAAGYFLGTPNAFTSENERIISDMEQRMGNLVLIGMPGCGKSTVGKILARITDKRFVDMDAVIEEETGRSIPQIFDEEGEAGFRAREAKTASELGKERGLVIATGGGAVLRTENVDSLRQNGRIIHVTRPIDRLATKGRPLSKDAENLRLMAQERIPIYRAAADITFDNARSCSRTKLEERLRRELKKI